MPDYIPSDDSSFGFWAESLARCISSEPEKYRFSPEQAAELVEVVQGFTSALQTASCLCTRTVFTVANKQDARKVCEQMCRRFAMVIKHDPSISNADKIAAGVTPKRPLPKRVQELLRRRDRLSLPLTP